MDIRMVPWNKKQARSLGPGSCTMDVLAWFDPSVSKQERGEPAYRRQLLRTMTPFCLTAIFGALAIRHNYRG